MDEKQVIDSINEQKMKARKAKGFSKNSIATSASIRIKDVASVAESSESNETPSEQPIETPKEEQKTPESGLSLDSLKLILQQAIDPLKNQIAEVTVQNGTLQSELDAAKTALEQTKEELEQTKKQADTLNELSKLIGSPVTAKPEMPMVNTRTAIDDSPEGIADEFINLFQSVQTTHNVQSASAGLGMIIASQRDHAPLNKFIQDHFRDEAAKGRSWRSSELIKQLESWGKKQGLLGGRSTNATTGPSTGGSMPNLFLDVLSALMRETHNNTNIFWQFPITVYDPTSAPSKNVLIPRFNYLAEPESVADFLLSDYSTYNALSLVTGTTSDSQALEATTVPVGISQFGLGRGTGVGTRAVYIPEFHQATSLVDLMTAVDSRLMQNYYRFEDLMLRTEYQKATTAYYNDANELTTNPTDIESGDLGTMTASFLDAVYSQMFDDKIPAFPDQCYFLAINSKAWKTLKRSLSQDFAPVTDEQKQAVSSIMKMATGIEIGRVSGYVGSYNGFHIFVTNSIGSGATADDISSHDVTLGGTLGTQVAYDSYAFGVGAVGRGIALPMEIRAQGAPFGLGSAYIWVSREGAGAIDVDSAATPTGQQTRVYKLRTLGAAV